MRNVAIGLMFAFVAANSLAAPANQPSVQPPLAVASAPDNSVSSVPTNPVSQAVANQQSNNTDANNIPDADIQRFGQALADIQAYYVKDVNVDTLFDNALKGMLTGLDPHSDYLGPDDLKTLEAETTGSFAGVGLELNTDKNYIVVVSPIDGSPAAKAGITAGDYIVKVDNKPVMANDLNDAVKQLRGEIGSKVKITLYHKKTNQLREVTLTRENINIQSVKSILLSPGYGYLRIAQFEQPTMHDVSDNLVKLVKANNNQPLQGLILDLRNDPGGLLESAIGVADAFLDSTSMGKNHLIVYTVGRVPDAHFEADATPGDLLQGAPIVVLINEGTASAAEIVAGALQDQHRAIILGTPSFGKGSVQTVMPLDDNHAIKMTTALYYTPSGRSIQAEGIKPDVYVPMMQVKALPDAHMIDMATIKEADLGNHLAASQSATAPMPNDQMQALLQDYQLQEALNMLQGLVVAKKQANSLNPPSTQAAK